MSFLKKVWVNNNNGIFSISMRQLPDERRWMHMTEMQLPPTDKVDGQYLSIEQAIEEGLAEWHFVLHNFNSAELLELRSAIDKALSESQRSTT